MIKTKGLMQPFFKYIGGKRWLAEKLSYHVSKLIHDDTYIEPFAGALGAFTSLHPTLMRANVQRIVLNDISIPVMSFYKSVIGNDGWLELYLELESEFNHSVKGMLKEELQEANAYFSSVKHRFNEVKGDMTPETSACFLFLQKHSFNGIYRENKKGEYNTPFNWNGKPIEIVGLNKALQEFQTELSFYDEVKFLCQSWNTIELNGFCYFDPPYSNENGGENDYSKGGFDWSQQMLILEKGNDVNFLYSNHATPAVLAEVDKHRFKYELVQRRNIMTAKKENRSDMISEILVWKE
jgi:DNA adenine methylase